MDAVMYNIEAQRLCETYRGCMSCPAFAVNKGCRLYRISEYFDPAEAVRIVEEWSKANPVQTRKDKFKEVFGSWPSSIIIGACTQEWWDAPYEAPKDESCE